jgi:hypothetical protein
MTHPDADTVFEKLLADLANTTSAGAAARLLDELRADPGGAEELAEEVLAELITQAEGAS